MRLIDSGKQAIKVSQYSKKQKFDFEEFFFVNTSPLVRTIVVFVVNTDGVIPQTFIKSSIYVVHTNSMEVSTSYKIS